ncbi:MAG: hypothetical protein RLN85_06670 [Pseudomonadales bacterium]
MNRRSFFKLTAGAAIAPVAAKLVNPLTPVLWGDGVHDDTSALQALLDGEVVEFANPSTASGAGWSENIFRMPGGIFRLSKGVEFKGKSNCEYHGNGSEIIISEDSDYGIKIDNCEDILVTGFYIRSEKELGTGIQIPGVSS